MEKRLLALIATKENKLIIMGVIIFGVSTYRYLGINTFFTFYQKNSVTSKFSW